MVEALGAGLSRHKFNVKLGHAIVNWLINPI